jgi:hypothetical protein
MPGVEKTGNQVPRQDWYQRAAAVIVREHKTLFQFVNEANLGLTSRECENLARTKEFQQCLRIERNLFHKELATDSTRSRSTAVGQLVFAISKMMEAEQWDKASNAIIQLAKLEGWTSDQAQLNIFNDLNAKDIEGLKKKLQDKLIKK